ncbi:MAG TPA: hypothetical protein DDZ81_14515 [Acetobacteraceae bacterium]|jgi:hypothetical protein|nr:hypothetical protein [Acetobacteraceae bacterium]
MPRYRLAAALMALTFGPAAQAQTSLCQAVAHHLWSDVAATPLREQTPLAELVAGAPRSFRLGERKPGRAVTTALSASEALAGKLRDLPPTDAIRFGNADIWLLDRVDGTLGCHTAIVAAVPPDGKAHEIDLPGNPDPSSLCALSALTAVTIDETPALWIEQSGAFSNSLGQSTVSIAALHGEAFDAPCTLTIDYILTDRAAHAFCDGVDCVPLTRQAEILAMRLRQQETAETLGAGAITTDDDGADYRRMAEIVAEEKEPVVLPTFGASIATPYTAFADQVVFPIRTDDGAIYLARMGHGGFGWRQTADTLLAVYRLRDDRLTPAASVYVSAIRTGIAGVAIQ